MRNVRSFLCRSLVAGIVLMLSVRPAVSQWVQLADFYESITSVYFLESVNLPNIGFVGAGGDIFRTMNGGISWTQVQTNIPGVPTGFAFKDGSTGWVSIGNDGVSSAIYKTVNGGLTWTPLNVNGIGSDVYYNPTTGLLFLSLRRTNAFSVISPDDGATWRYFNNETDENGFAFCDPMHGMLTSLGVTYGTSDGGNTWSILPLGLHSWSPCAIPNTSTFVAANDMGQKVYNSTDAGKSWNQIPGIPAGDELSGCVQPGRCGVYVQTSQGIYESPTLKGWTFIGGPGNTFDSRFFAGTKYVYAGGTGGDIQRLQQQATDWPTLQFQPSSLILNEATGCPPKSVVATFVNLTCLPVSVVTAGLSDSLQWILGQHVLPDTLAPGDTIQFDLTGIGKLPGKNMSNLQLLIKSNVGTTDTALPLTINVQGVIPPTLRPVSVTLHDRCTPLDTVFRIQNNHCVTIRVTSIAMKDSTLFSLLGFTLPIILAPDSVCDIPVHAQPKAKGLFEDSAAVTFSYDAFTLDTSVTLTGNVPSSIIAASFSDSAISFDTISNCEPKLDTIYMKNIACDSAQITLAQLGVSSAFIMSNNILHTILGPDDSIPIIIELPGSTTGNYSDELDILLDNGAYREEYPIKLSGSVVHGLATPIISASTLQRDSIPPCANFDTSLTMTFTSACADSLQISSIQYSGTGNITITSSPTLPSTIHNGDTVKYNISYSPVANEVVAGKIEVKGIGFDTLLPLHFSAGSGGAGQLSMSAKRSTLSANFCHEDSLVIELYNTGCVSSFVDSLAIQSLFPNQTQFLLPTIKVPFTIPTEDSVPIKVYYAGDGVGNGSATLLAREPGGKLLTQPISGSTIPTSSARVGIALSPSSRLNPVVGETTTPYLYFVDAVPASNALLSLNCNVAFNANVLQDLVPVGQNGWSVNELSSTQTGVSLAITRTTATPIAAGDQIATLPLEAYISDTLSTPIALTSLNFSPADPNYERCTLAAAIAPPMLNVTVNTQCGDSALSAILRGDRIIISSVQVKPNPLTKNGASEMTVSFISSERAIATVTISDVLGRTRATASTNATVGSNSIALPTNSLDEGVYYVDVAEGRTHVVTRVAVIGDR